jgi:hypothetical protein
MEIGEWHKIKLPLFECYPMFNFPENRKETMVEFDALILEVRGDRVVVLVDGNRELLINKSEVF